MADGDGSIITLDEAKRYLRIGTNGADTLVGELIASVEALAAKWLGTAFSVTSQVEYLSGGQVSLRPTLQPIVAVSKITDIWNDEEITSTYYRIVEDGIEYIGESTTPSLWTAGARRYKVEYTAGYNNGDSQAAENSTSAPGGIKLGLLALIYRAYKAQGGVNQQGAAQSHMSLDKILESDIALFLGPYDLKGHIH